MADSTGGRQPLLLLGVEVDDPRAFSLAPVVAWMCLEANWKFDVLPARPGLGRHFGGGRAAGRATHGGSFVGAGYSDQVRFLLDHYNLTAVGSFSRAIRELIPVERIEPATTDVVHLLDALSKLLDVKIPRKLLVLDGNKQGSHEINTAAYQFPRVLKDRTFAVDVRDYDRFATAFRDLGVTEHESLYLAPSNSRESLAPGGPELGEQSYAEFTTSLLETDDEWSQGLLLGDPALVLSSLARAAQLRLVPVYGRPQVDALRALPPNLRWRAHGSWGRQYDDRDFVALSARGLPLQLIDVGPPLHTVGQERALASATGGHVTDITPPEDVSDAQLWKWAAEGRVLTSLLYWCGSIREIEAAERVADLVAMTSLRGGIALTVPAVHHVPYSLAPLLLSCRDAGGGLEALLASRGDGILFESGLDPDDLAQHLAEMRRELERLTNQPIRGWWPLLDGALHPIRRSIKFREGRLVLPREFAGRADEDRPHLEPRIVRHLHRARIMQARPAEWVRPSPPDLALLRAVGSAGFDYLLSKSSTTPIGLPGIPTAVPSAAEWGGWTPFRTVATSRDFRRLIRRALRSPRAGFVVATVDVPLWLQSGESWQHNHQMAELARTATGARSSDRIINVTPATVARYVALLGASHPDLRR